MSVIDCAIIKELGKITDGIDSNELSYMQHKFEFDEEGRLIVDTSPALFDYFIFKRKGDDVNPWTVYLCCSTHDHLESNKFTAEYTFIKIYGPSIPKYEHYGLRGIIKFATASDQSIRSREGGYDQLIELPVPNDPSTGGAFSSTKWLNLTTIRYLLGYLLDPYCSDCIAPEVLWNQDDKP